MTAKPPGKVDHRPFIERNADQIVLAALFGIVGCGLLGLGVGAAIAVYLTTPPKES